MISERQAVEVFHLHFVRLLMAGRDKGGLIVKGGCNLRFFFGSIRYSEDLDLDVRHVSEEALGTRVRSVLDSTVLEESLQIAGIAVVRTSAPKQASTTQRWKIAIRIRGIERDIGAWEAMQLHVVAALEAIGAHS